MKIVADIVDIDGNKIINVATPSTDTDSVSKIYVDDKLKKEKLDAIAMAIALG